MLIVNLHGNMTSSLLDRQFNVLNHSKHGGNYSICNCTDAFKALKHVMVR